VIKDGIVVEEGKFHNLKNQENGYFATLAAGMSHPTKPVVVDNQED
jgi:hypothetical protein